MNDSAPKGIRRAEAQFGAVARKLKEGATHPTLGFHVHGNEDDWWKAGAKNFNKLMRLFHVKAHDRVVDYGCGSLRIGAHLIRYLEPGCYAGLEVTGELLDIGKELVGPELLEAKHPLLATIDEDSIAAACALDARLVFSHAVAKNVVHDELDYYLSALRRIAHAPGCILYFSAKLAESEVEYEHGAWARPLDWYVKPLAPLQFARIYGDSEDEAEGGIRNCKLEFRHP